MSNKNRVFAYTGSILGIVIGITPFLNPSTISLFIEIINPLDFTNWLFAVLVFLLSGAVFIAGLIGLLGALLVKKHPVMGNLTLGFSIVVGCCGGQYILAWAIPAVLEAIAIYLTANKVPKSRPNYDRK